MKTQAGKVRIFVALTFGLSWLLAGAFYLAGGRWSSPAAVLLGVVYMFVPLAVAVLVQKVICREPVWKPLGVSFKLNRWFLIAWLLPPALSLATLAVSLLLPGIAFSLDMAAMFERLQAHLPPEQLAAMRDGLSQLPFHPFWLVLLQGLLAGPTLNAVVAFGEEAGWRGLLERETRALGFWKQSAFIGLIWGVWHAPLILQGHNYPQHPVAGVFMMTLFTILLTPIFIYVRLQAKSVVAAAVMHGSLNATGALSMMLVRGGDDLTTGITGVPGFLVLAALNLVLFVHLRRQPGPVAAGGEVVIAPQYTSGMKV